MRINSISISKRYQGAGYDCRVNIDADYQSVQLRLDEEYTQKVIAIVAELIVDGSKRIADNLTKQALDHKAIEHQAG